LIELAPGYAISRLLKGGWQLAGGHGRVDRESALGDMFRFVEAGITTFDCADIYSGVEELIGEFLRRYRERFGAEAAAGLHVHTKFVPDLAALDRLTGVDVERAIDRSLARLAVERLDLVQFHWWDYDVPRWVEIGLQLTELQRRGKIRLLGATNFDVPRLAALLEAGVPIVSHQVQYSLIDRRPENGMVALCAERGVRLLCYGSLLGGFLSEAWLDAPEPLPPQENRSLTKYKLILEEFGSWAAFQGLLRELRAVGERHGVGISSVALRWALDRPQVAAVIVGARNAKHLAATARALNLSLDTEDLRRLDAACAAGSSPLGDTYALERIKGGRHAAVMRYDLNEPERRPLA